MLWSSLNNGGTVEVDEKKYGDPGQLHAASPVAVSRRLPQMRVLIRADKSVRYEYLRAVMVACGNAGVGNVTFSVVDKDSASSASQVTSTLNHHLIYGRISRFRRR